MKRNALRFAPTCLLLALIGLLGALPFKSQSQQPDPTTAFTKTEVMIPARDGVRLNTEFYAPKDAREALAGAAGDDGKAGAALPHSKGAYAIRPYEEEKAGAADQ